MCNFVVDTLTVAVLELEPLEFLYDDTVTIALEKFVTSIILLVEAIGVCCVPCPDVSSVIYTPNVAPTLKAPAVAVVLLDKVQPPVIVSISPSLYK